MEWVYLFIAVIAEVIATTALKATESFTKLWPSLVAIAGYGIAFYLLTLTLDKIPLGVAYAVWSAFGIALVTVAAAILYGQTLDAPALAGITLICCGVAVINLFSKSVPH